MIEGAEYTSLDFRRYFGAKSINVDNLSTLMTFKIVTLHEGAWRLAERSEENQN